MAKDNSAEQLSQQLSGAAASRVRARDDGSLDVMGSVGGWRGLAEASLPAAGFPVAYLLTEDLVPAILLAVGMGAVFTIIRLLQRGSLIQSFSGLIGVGICAAFAYLLRRRSRLL